MEKEAFETPKVIRRALKENQNILGSLAKRLQNHPPPFVMTNARGSSDHASTFAKYLFESRLGWVTSSAAPSVVTMYGANLNVDNALVLGISQSGQSPDVCEILETSRRKGAITVAMVNDVNSPLAGLADYVIPLWVGEEKAVAATKSYISSLFAILHFSAIYLQDYHLLSQLEELPDVLEETLTMDWSGAVAILKEYDDVLVVARGFGYPIAQEAALKFKETCSIHAEAFSGAEILHGPLALVGRDYPVLMFIQEDLTYSGMLELAQKVISLGGKPLLAYPKSLESEVNITSVDSILLPLPASLDSLCDPIMAIQAFYPMIAHLSTAKGKSPDHPKNLKKVTKTR